MIQLDRVTYTYPTGTRPALKEISLEIPAGQFCAIIGANGAGKSTLANTIAGFVPHFYHGELQGRILIDGKDSSQATLSELVLSVGLIFQNPFNQISGTKYSVREEIAFGLENLGIPRQEMVERIDGTMSLVGISDLADRPPLALSGGQMQRVAIASVLAMRPKILVLDEPTSQLDPLGSLEVFSTVRSLAAEGSTTVVMIEHKLEWVAEFADRVIAMAGGDIILDGKPNDVLVDEAMSAHGIGQTRYTQAGRLAQSTGRWPPGHRIPVTLREAEVEFGPSHAD